MTDHRSPIVPDFTPVTPEQVRHHLDTCPDCRRGPMGSWCEAGRALWAAYLARNRAEMDREPRRQAWELIRAGWSFELPAGDPGVMSWWWRSPPKRAGGRGRFHASTNQAWRAMMRGEGMDPDAPRPAYTAAQRLTPDADTLAEMAGRPSSEGADLDADPRELY